MKVITVAHQKGGVGKTTLALNLAYCFADQAKVALVDTDAQGSIADLKSFLQDVDVVSIDPLLAGTLTGYDLVIIDTPPYLSNRLTDIFAISDFVLIPTKPGILDAMAIRATITLLEQSIKAKPTLKAGIVLNMVMPRTNLTDEVKEILTEYSIPLLESAISQRVSYTRSPMTNSVFGGDDNRAKDEVVSLATEILQYVNQ